MTKKHKGDAKIALTAKKVEHLTEPGIYKDITDNLYLLISKSGGKSWIFRYQKDHRRRDMGLGSVSYVSLLEARQKASELLLKIKTDPNCDPIEERKASKIKVIKNIVPSFAWCAEQYIQSKKDGWSNIKSEKQWRSSLEMHAYPAIGELEVDKIETENIDQLLKKIWITKNETATRVRSRIECILNWAAVNKYRDKNSMNPAVWKGNLEHLLPKPSSVKVVENFASLPYKDIGIFLKDLKKRKGISPLALNFLILTAARTSETVLAEWSEIDFRESLWIRPAEHMKSRSSHTVTMPTSAVQILQNIRDRYDDRFIFPGGKSGQSLSTNAMDTLLEDSKRP